MNTDTNTRVIDADAHVVECAHTWDFMDPSDRAVSSHLVSRPAKRPAFDYSSG